jgi:16S rRNA C1402 N4-methylase RsmH
MVVISFHSLEDRIVKQFINDEKIEILYPLIFQLEMMSYQTPIEYCDKTYKTK